MDMMVEPETEAMVPNKEDLSIDALAALSDEELSHVLGFDTQIARVKETLAEMQKLEGEEREKAEEALVKIFTPHIHPSDFTYALDCAKEEDDHMTSNSPSSVLDY